jgi:glycosyltransferase involved in cell wall biosynthesis
MPALSDTSPEISFVIPVYNKAEMLPAVLRALSAQQLPGAAEYIFVDDASTDASVAVLETEGKALPGLSILRNSGNRGPSLRINQGVAQARGRLLCLIDADELIVPDAVMLMHGLLRDRQADMIHGKVIRGDKALDATLPAALGRLPDYAVSDTPLDAILHGRGFVRMAWLVETALFRAAGGCDERLFIQDEALPLRLARHARRFIDFRGGMTYAPRIGSHLSADKRQQHHDRFFAYLNLLQDAPALNPAQRRQATAICASIAWKAQRRSGLPLAMPDALLAYLGGKLGIGVSDAFLARAADAFRRLPRIRYPLQ